MLKKLIFFYLAVILTFFSISFANEGNFKNYSEINKCIPFSNDLGEYALNIENCFKKYNQKFSDDFYLSLEDELPDNFFQRVNFGDETNQYLDEKYVNSKSEIYIENYIKKFPNHIYAIDKLLRGDEPIIKEFHLSKLHLLPQLFGSLPTKEIVTSETINEINTDTLHLGAALFYLPYRYLANSIKNCEINAVLT